MIDAPELTSTPESLKDQGLRLFFDGQYPQALEAFEQARAGFLARGDEAGVGEMLNNLGVIFQKTGRWDEAMRALDEARLLFGRLGDRHREAQAVGNLGSLLVAHGDRKRGAAMLQEAAGMFRALNEAELHSATLRALSRACMQTGDLGSALGYYAAAIDALESPSPAQRALRRLLTAPARMLGRS